MRMSSYNNMSCGESTSCKTVLPETRYINELTLTGLEVSVLPSVVDRVVSASSGGEVGVVSGVGMATLVVITTTEGAVTTGV